MSCDFTAVDFTLIAGQDNAWTLTLKGSSGSPLDLTALTSFTYRARADAFATSDLISRSLGSGASVVSPATDGKVRLSIPASLTQAIPSGEYPHEAFFVLDGATYRALRGTLCVDGKLGTS